MGKLLPALNFPFAAVVGQDKFKLALTIAAVNPLVGGVLVSGPRGCAKSTLAKGLADILPDNQQQKPPFVSMPLGTSEEMLIGTLNLQQVMEQQSVVFQPGLLAKADKGVLYVDEVNLLADNLVDHLLDVAASGVNIIERDGISQQHSANFILLGTMNPDEGELRPQLTDRFGLYVELHHHFSIEERMKIVRLREQFEQNSEEFVQRFSASQQALKVAIASAKQRLSAITCDDSSRRFIAERCVAAHVDGVRADIVWVQAALAHAALAGREMVNESDILAVEALVLGHRRNSPPNSPNHSQRHSPPNGELKSPSNLQKSSIKNQTPQQFSRPEQKAGSAPKYQGDWGAMEALSQDTESIDAIHFSHKFSDVSLPKAVLPHITRVSNRCQGMAKGLRQSSQHTLKIHWFRTLIANKGSWPLTTLRYLKQRRGQARIHLILLDTSGSVLQHRAFSKAKGLILQVAERAYLQRENIAILGFGNGEVHTLFATRRAPKAIQQYLNEIQASGGTPINAAIEQASHFQQQQLLKTPGTLFQNYVLTDGRVRSIDVSASLVGHTTVVDIEQSAVKRGKAQQLADLLHADYHLLPA